MSEHQILGIIGVVACVYVFVMIFLVLRNP